MAGDSNFKCVVVGAGPVGALSALYAARRGWDVEVYELRGDLRDASITPLNFTKSINLALSVRGIEAMKASGSTKLLNGVMAETVPMYGRMIHGEDSSGQLTEQSQQYDVHGRYNSAIDRGNLNKLMLDELSDLPNVKLFFHQRLAGVDFDKRKAWFEQKSPNTSNPQTADGAQSLNSRKPKDRQTEIEVDFDLILGCDGAHSAVRFHMMKFVRMNYEQSYIDTLWCEFTIPPLPSRPENDSPRTTTPSSRDGFATSPNHLHIWPSNHSDAMFIAIPSIDKSFTCTLFASSSTFEQLSHSPAITVPAFFEQNFPGALPLLGGPEPLINSFTTNPHLPLISIKCSPHVHTPTSTTAASGAILGDAAHAMVPFYGQGMNAGLEDVHALFTQPDLPTNSHTATTRSDLARALRAYNTARVPDAHTINDLALQNYWEMHSGTTSPLRLARKRVEEFLSSRLLHRFTGFATEYERVSFSCQRYSELVHAVRRQSYILLGGAVGVGILPGLVWAGWWVWRIGRTSKAGLGAGRGLLGLGVLGERVGRMLT